MLSSVLLLTGTPIENRLSELWSIFDYLMPGLLGSYQQFRKQYEGPIIKNQDDQAQDDLKRFWYSLHSCSVV